MEEVARTMSDGGDEMMQLAKLDDASPVPNRGLSELGPQNMRQLAWFAGTVAKSGMFKHMTQSSAFLAMAKGAEYGLTPMQSLEYLFVVPGRPATPTGQLIAALIQSDPRTIEWTPTRTGTSCVIRARRTDRVDGSGIPMVLETRVRIEDVEASAKGKAVWQQQPHWMLYWRCVRAIAKEHFGDMLIGLNIPQLPVAAKVIDIDAVQERVGRVIETCPKCGAEMRLVANPAGGAFLACPQCAQTAAPPAVVRDAIRGHLEASQPEGVDEEELEEIDYRDDDYGKNELWKRSEGVDEEEPEGPGVEAS